MTERLLEAIAIRVTAGRVGVRRTVRGLIGWLEDWASKLVERVERQRGHALSLALLTALVVVVMRHILFSGEVPAGTDSAFLFSNLRLYSDHHILAFTGWAPEPFGQAQQYSIYWLLAMLTTATGSVLGVYKAALLAAFLLGAFGAYRLAFWVAGSRLGAFAASAVYAFAPFSVAQWLGGHLNVEISYALGPWLLWALWLSLRTGSRRAMIGLGLAGSADYLLTTGQAFYWLLPLAVVAAAEAIRQRTLVKEYARRLLTTAALAGAVFLAASAVELLPFAAGVKAPFADSGSKFYIQGLAIHAKYSESFVENVLGVPTEDWSTTSLAGSSFGDFPYSVVAVALLAFAGSAFWSTRRKMAAVIAVPAVIAWFISAGPNGPAHHLYIALYDHMPYFSLLRVPNRWTMVATLGVALLIGLRIAALRSRERDSGGSIAARRPSTVAAAWLACVVLFMGAYAFLHGLPTQRLPASYATAYTALASDHEDVRVLTTPFWQAWMPLAGRGAATTIGADLGAVSRYWNGHPTVFRGGWDPRAARFVSYLYDLVKQGTTRSLAKIVGAVGVKYIGINPHRAIEVVPGQNAFFERQLGLVPFVRSGPVRIYRNRYALPPAYVVHKTCVIAGGMHVLGDLADQSWFSFARTGLVFADQIAATGGRAELAATLRTPGQCIVLARGGLPDLHVLLDAADVVSASSQAPAALSQSPTDPATDVGAEPTSNVDILPGQALTVHVRAPQTGGYALWVGGLYGLGRGRLAVQIDGRRKRPVDFLNAGSGIAWTPLRPVVLTAGRHSVTLTNNAPIMGPPTEVSQIALMPARPLRWLTALEKAPNVLRESGGPGPLPARVRIRRPVTEGRWQLQDGNGPAVTATTAADRGLSINVLRAGRRYYTLARLPVNGGVNPNRALALHFRGAGSGRTFYLIASFGADPQARAVFGFRDSTRNERTILISPLQPSSVDSVPEWSKVTDFSLAVNSRSRIASPIVVAGPFSTALDDSPRFGPARALAQLTSPRPASAVLAPRDQMIEASAHLKSHVGPGMLVLTQAFDAQWRLHGTEPAHHTVALGFANGYSLDRPIRNGALTFDAARWGRAGTVISLFAWLTGLALLFAPTGARTRRRARRLRGGDR